MDYSYESSATSYIPHHCVHCRKIIIRPPRKLERPGRFRYRLPYSVPEAREAANDGCSLYQSLMREYLKIMRKADLIDWWISTPKEDKTRPDFVIRLAEIFRTRPFDFGAQLLENGDSASPSFAWFDICGDVRLTRRVTAYLEDPAASVFRMRPINRNVGSDSAFKTARDWLDECGNHVDDSHQLCPLVKDIVFTPTRLLEIRKVGREYSAHLRTTNGDSIRYACLSYCWGGDQPVKTTKATIVSRHIGITFSTLPQTLQEAIISAFKIGVSHIWIDCLCIVQDDKEDLAAELIKMPEIYKNAYVTISASSASNCREGFLSSRYPSTEDLTLQYECPDGQIGNIYMFEERIGNKDDPIRTRAWCLQERILSPRLLDFSSQQLQWKCNSLNQFDGGYASYTHNNLFGRVHTDDIKHAIMEIWSENVDQYARCSLSFPADKLVAIGAMASHVGDALKMAYLAGLWREVLPEQLLWHNRTEPAARLQEYRAPSWSWASIDAPVVFRRYWMSYPDMGRFAIEILETSVQLLSAEHLYGPVLSAKLVLEGRLVKALWYVNRRDCIAVDTRPLAVLPRFRKEIGRVTNKFFGWNSQSNIDKSSTPEHTEYEEVTIGMSVDALESDWDFEDPDFAVEAHCLLVKSHSESGSAEGIILIRARSGQEDHYTRAGLFWFFKDGVLPDLFRLAKDRIITIL